MHHALIILFLARCSFGQCTTYDFQSISGPNCGITGQAGAIGYGMSENGVICGGVGMCNGDLLPFVRFPGGPLTILTAAGAEENGRARAVNSSGVVVGHVDTNALSFVYQGGNVTWLQPLPEYAVTDGLAINDLGNVVGTCLSFSVLSACAWFNGKPTDLNLPLGPMSAAADINENNQVCGWMGVGYIDGASPFIWQDGKTTALPLPPGAFNDSGEATAINNLGDVCGFYFVFDRKHKTYVRQACAWIDGELIDLGTLPGYAGSFPAAINDAREIVGYVTEETGVALVPFLWRDGVMYDVNTLMSADSPFLSIAWAINNRGQITGQGHTTEPNLHSVALLLTPAPPQTPGDVNCDATVNVTDLLAVISAWDRAGPVGGHPADLNRDNRIDELDLIETILNWG